MARESGYRYYPPRAEPRQTRRSTNGPNGPHPPEHPSGGCSLYERDLTPAYRQAGLSSFPRQKTCFARNEPGLASTRVEAGPTLSKKYFPPSEDFSERNLSIRLWRLVWYGGYVEREIYHDRYKKEDSHWWFLARQAALNAYLTGAENHPYEILDIGCGTAGTSVFLKRYGDVTGVENNQEALLLAANRDVRVMAGDAEALPVRNHTYDVVFMLETLAHRGIKNEQRALQEAYRALKPGGHLMVTVPAFSWLESPHDRLQHIERRYRKARLIALLEEAGFRVDRATYLSWLFLPFSFLGRRIERHLGVDRMDIGTALPLMSRLLLLLHRLEAKLLSFIELPWGSSIMIRAVKPQESSLAR